jgi:tetratricopeptide (TPR) repeat protein
MNNQERYDHIEAYLLHQMTDEERSDFERAMKSDESLQAQVREHEKEHELMELLVEHDLRQKVGTWRDEMAADKNESGETSSEDQEAKTIPMFRNRPMLFSIAAAVLVLLAISFLLLRNKGEKPEDMIADDQDTTEVPIIVTPLPEKENITEQKTPEEKEEPAPEPKPKPPISTPDNSKLLAVVDRFDEVVDFDSYNVRSESEDLPVDQALDLFGSKNYQQGIDLLKPLISPDDGEVDQDAMFLSGIGYDQLKQYNKAIPLFESLAADPFYGYRMEAQWRLALAYLRTDKLDKGKSLLKVISGNSDHDYADSATKFLNEIEK